MAIPTAGNAGGALAAYAARAGAEAYVFMPRDTPAANLTNADTLVFLATFDEDVQNVDTSDFTVNSTSTATGARSPGR